MPRFPPLILVPGLLCTTRLWRDQLTALAELARPAVTTAQAEHASLAAIAEAILEQVPDRFQLAGLSFGGYVAFEILRRAPERVERLALLNTQARADDDATVTDPTGRVHGIAGLRVCDASVMPMVPSANTNLPTMMIAEKIADAVLSASDA